MSDWLCRVTFSSDLIPVQWRHISGAMVYCFPPLFYPSRGWVIPLVGITDYIRSTFLRDHIIDTYHHLIHDPYRRDGAVSHFPEFLFQGNVVISPPPWVIVGFFLFLCSPLADECKYTLGSLIKSEVIYWAIILFLYIIILYVTLVGLIMQHDIIKIFNSSSMEIYYCHHCLFVFWLFLLFLLFFFVHSLWMSATTHYEH